MWWFKVSVNVVVLLGCASASIVELNDTMLRAIPPLYALDEWSACQRPDDVYCMVDAALISREPSPLLTFLQEYSKETLKHYNRTVIHRGVCISQCGGVEEGSWHPAAQRCLNHTLAAYGLEAEVLSVGWCSSKEVLAGDDVVEGGGAWSGRALAVLCTLLAALATLATALHVLADRLGKTDGNKYLLAFSLKCNWAILTYDRSKPRSDSRMKDVACIEGIRVLGMQCVIFSHVMLIYGYSYIDNPEFVEKMYDQVGWQAVLNSPLWIQAFFSISGFLTTYTVLITSGTNPITPLKCLMSVFNRWIRLTPLAVFVLWFTMAWFPALGVGPQWGWLVTREAADCSQRWWYHVLYVHNHLPTGKFCMGHTWYLAVDMQLHVCGLVLLAVAARWRMVGRALLAALLVSSMLAAGALLYTARLLPIVAAQPPEALRTLFLGSATLTRLYLPAWMNLPGYLGGVATAFLYHRTQVHGLKLNQNKWFRVVFHLSLALGGCVVAGGGAAFLCDKAPPRWAATLYATCDRALVTLAFNLFLMGCLSHCTSGLRSLLEWRGFHALGRLSYGVFVVHFVVLRLTMAAHTQIAHVSLLAMISLLITSSVLSYMAAVPLCLFVELPALQLWKAATERDTRPAPAPPLAPGSSKPLDLLANLSRRPPI